MTLLSDTVIDKFVKVTRVEKSALHSAVESEEEEGSTEADSDADASPAV